LLINSWCTCEMPGNGWLVFVFGGSGSLSHALHYCMCQDQKPGCRQLNSDSDPFSRIKVHPCFMHRLARNKTFRTY
jgi:hypothetical protein